MNYYKKGDFKKLELLGQGKKHTKIYRVQHISSNKIFALKEIEANNLEKLNEYKEEAVQLMKVQNCGNVIRFYGYYFSETLYNTYRLGIIIEYMEHSTNLENLYRRRRKANQFWKEQELVKMLFSLISTCSYLQQKGICHRDIKPANLFLMANGELKLIDFGESKDYFYDDEDDKKNTYTMATIRGTPQYLSPILWKAHVIDGNSRFVQHNIYKSDVFSSGLVLFQISAMQEVTGFNNQSPQTDGESLTFKSLNQLERTLSPSYVSLLRLMLIFEESQRPTFVDIENLFIEHEDNGKNGNGQVNEYIVFYNQNYNTQLKRGPAYRTGLDSEQTKSSGLTQVKRGPASLASTQLIGCSSNEIGQIKSSQPQMQVLDTFKVGLNESKNQNLEVQLQKQRQKEMNFYKDSTLILNDCCYWFEFGGKVISKFSIVKLKWKQITKLDYELGKQFSSISVPDQKACFLFGGPSGDNFRVFQNNRLTQMRVQLGQNRFFSSCLYYNHKIYCIGGYDANNKQQVSSCHAYDMQNDKWNQLADLKQQKSSAAACRINDLEIVVFGGYNKEEGTLDTIEKYLINENKWEKCQIKLPIPLRRFTAVRIKRNLALLIGGLTLYSKENQRVFKVDWDRKEIIECEPLEKGGVVESEVLVDNDGQLHIFLENANGTSPHAHIKYYFDPNATKYITKAE